MDGVKQTLKQKTAMFDAMGNKVPPLVDLAKSMEMNSGFFVAAAAALFCFFMLIFHGIEIAVTCYTVIYPGMCSVRAIESPEADDDKHWLTYWMIIGFLDVAETFAPFIFWIVPYWSFFRFALFVWLINFNGAEFIFTNALQPILKAHKDVIQSYISNIGGSAQKYADQAKAEAMAAAADPNNLVKVAGLAAQVNTAAQEEKQ